jgi:hypothetical protein
MRLLPGIYGALLSLAIGTGEAMAACCYTAPVHVYVPHVVVVPHTTHVVVPHTTNVHPLTTTRVNPTVSTSTAKSTTSALQTVHAKPHPHTVQTVIVDTQAAPASKGCKRGQAGPGCKKPNEDESGWTKVRRWLHIGQQ